MSKYFQFDPENLQHILVPVEELPADHPVAIEYAKAVEHGVKCMKEAIEREFLSGLGHAGIK